MRGKQFKKNSPLPSLIVIEILCDYIDENKQK